MTKEELKALGLTDDQVSKIYEDYGKNYAPKSQLNEKIEALKLADREKGEMGKQLDALKKNNKSNDELTKQIETLQQAAKDREKEYAGQMAQIRLDNAVDRALTGAKARNVKAARALLDLTDAKLDDKGEVVGLGDKIKALQKSDAYLFDGEGTKKMGGFKPSESGEKHTEGKYSMDDLANMTPEEINANWASISGQKEE